MKHVLTRQDVRAICGRMIICGFEGDRVTPELKEILREVEPLGLVLFARNIESPEHVHELNRELKGLRPQEPLMLAIDHEGGRVARFKEPATVWPAMRVLGRRRDPRLAHQVGLAMGRELRALNFDIDFAPVLDVDTNPDNPVIGERALSEDPVQVGILGAALARGLQEANVAACGKHFPGHGDTTVDSHHALPILEHDLDRLRAIEWPPFRAAIEAGLDAVMTAHVLIDALDREHPATLSPRILEVLREELGFRGVVVSDDLEMKAVAERYAPEDLALRTVTAGVDVLLPCKSPEMILGVFRGLVQATEQQRVTHARLLESDRRIRAWHRRYQRAPVGHDAFKRWVGCGEHLALAETIRAATDEA